MAAAAPPQIVLDAMIACGCDNAVMWNGETAATRIASNVFDDDFSSCMDNSFDDLDQDLKSYASLTAANGQICLNPKAKKQIQGFINGAEIIFVVMKIPVYLLSLWMTYPNSFEDTKPVKHMLKSP